MKIEFVLEQKSHEVEYDPGESVLDAAIRHELNPPYSCMEGFCMSCRGKILEGKVDFPDDTILTEDEVKQGIILTCQAKPQANCLKLKIDYDAI